MDAIEGSRDRITWVEDQPAVVPGCESNSCGIITPLGHDRDGNMRYAVTATDARSYSANLSKDDLYKLAAFVNSGGLEKLGDLATNEIPLVRTQNPPS